MGRAPTNQTAAMVGRQAGLVLLLIKIGIGVDRFLDRWF
jgi:hypothetical protein